MCKDGIPSDSGKKINTFPWFEVFYRVVGSPEGLISTALQGLSNFRVIGAIRPPNDCGRAFNGELYSERGLSSCLEQCAARDAGGFRAVAHTAQPERFYTILAKVAAPVALISRACRGWVCQCWLACLERELCAERYHSLQCSRRCRREPDSQWHRWRGEWKWRRSNGNRTGGDRACCRCAGRVGRGRQRCRWKSGGDRCHRRGRWTHWRNDNGRFGDGRYWRSGSGSAQFIWRRRWRRRRGVFQRELG